MPTYCQQLPESLLSKSPLHDRKIEDPEDNFNMSPHVLTCIELRHTHTMLFCLVSPFFMHVLHICSMNAQEIPHTDPYGHPSSVFSRRNWSWSTHTRRGRWMIGGPPNGMSLDVLLMGYLGGLLLHIITSV